MSNEPTPDKEHSITAEDAVRLKHSLGKSITWGSSNLNALEIEQLTRLERNDYAEVRKDYAKWNSSRKLYLLFALLVLLVVAYFTHGLVRTLSVIGAITCFYEIGRREGHAEGYIDGYDAGHEAGIHKMLGIKNEEIADMSEMATQMKVDEMVVNRMDERKAKDSSEQTKP
jgi:hypothetical protein